MYHPPGYLWALPPGKFASDGRRPTIRDVAAQAGVSIGTASKALNGQGKLRAATRDRVAAAARELGFAPNVLAKALLAGRTYTVGLITSDSFGRFSIPVMLGAEDAPPTWRSRCPSSCSTPGRRLLASPWWPPHPARSPGSCWAHAATCASLSARRSRWSAFLAAFRLAVPLVIWPADALTPAHAGNVWALYAAVLAVYGPFSCQCERRKANLALAMLVVAVTRAWQRSVTIITIGLLRTAAGPLLAPGIVV